jgi:hypothetical protein
MRKRSPSPPLFLITVVCAFLFLPFIAEVRAREADVALDSPLFVYSLNLAIQELESPAKKQLEIEAPDNHVNCTKKCEGTSANMIAQPTPTMVTCVTCTTCVCPTQSGPTCPGSDSCPGTGTCYATCPGSVTCHTTCTGTTCAACSKAMPWTPLLLLDD